MAKMFCNICWLLILLGCFQTKTVKNLEADFYEIAKQEDVNKYMGLETFVRGNLITVSFFYSEEESVDIVIWKGEGNIEIVIKDTLTKTEREYYATAKNIAVYEAEQHFEQLVKSLFQFMKKTGVYKVSSLPWQGDFISFYHPKGCVFIYYPPDGVLRHKYWKEKIPKLEVLGKSWYYYEEKNLPKG